MGWLMALAIFGPLPADEGIARCDDFLEKAGDDAKVGAFAHCARAVLEAMRGDFDAARESLAVGRRAFESLGLKVWIANNAQQDYFIETLAGNPARALDVLRASYAELERMGDRVFNSTIAGMLANVLEALGLDEEAIRFSRESERGAPTDDYGSQALWRTALAKVLVRQGHTERAEALAREAVDVLPGEMLLSRGLASLDLAAVLAAAGRREEAKRAAAEAAQFSEAKGNLATLGAARRFLDDLG
jgi:tetratricopeptide (TPR) repeat protein